MDINMIDVRQIDFKRGEQSRQAEIEELKKELEILQGMHNAVSLTAGDLLDERDELQKRIYEVLKELKYINKSIWEEVVDISMNILKGNKSD